MEQEENHKISPRLIDFVEKLSRYCSSRLDYIVVPSYGVAQQLVQSMGMGACRQERLRVIYNPVVDSWLYQKSQAAIAHPWFQVDQPPVILAVGRLTAQKDYETLLKSFAKVRQRLCVRLIIFGDGPMRDQLEALVRSLAMEDDVLLPGFVDNPYAYMGRASVFVLSSVWETFGMVLVEALACGCPVVSTDCDYGPAEILENGRYGRLVPVKDVDEIAHALEASLQATHDRDLLQRRAQDFSLDQSVRQYLELMGIVDSTTPSRPMADCVTPDVS